MSRSNQQRVAPRRKASLARAAGCLAVLAVALTSCATDDLEPRPDLSQRAVELAKLRTSDGLFARPATAADRQPSIFDSGYLLPFLSEHDMRADDEHRLNATYQQACDEDALWATWSTSQLPGALRAQISVDAACTEQAADQALAEGQNADTDIAQVTALAEALSVLSPDLLTSVREEAKARIAEAVTDESAPYLRVRAAQGLEILESAPGLDPADAEGFRAPEALTRTEDLMDLWATLKVDHDEALDARAREMIAPLLADPRTEGREFDLAYALPAWKLAGGGSDLPAGVIKAIEDRIDPATGLVSSSKIIIGTVDSTYEIARSIPGDEFAWIAREGTAKAVQGEVKKMTEIGDALGLLKAGFVLHQLGLTRDASDAVSAGRKLAQEQLGDEPVAPPQAGLLTSVYEALDLLGEKRFRVELTDIDAGDDESLSLLYSLVPYMDTITNGDDFLRKHQADLRKADEVLREPDEYPAQLVLGALKAAAHEELDDDAAAASGSEWLESLRGCDGYSSLYRAPGADTSCVLPLTADALEIERNYAASNAEGQATS